MALLSPIIGREPKSSIRRFLKVGFPGTAFSLVYGGAGSVHGLSSCPATLRTWKVLLSSDGTGSD